MRFFWCHTEGCPQHGRSVTLREENDSGSVGCASCGEPLHIQPVWAPRPIIIDMTEGSQ